MFFRRGLADNDPWVQTKLWLFSLGALVALVGMIIENSWVIGAAGLVLGIGVVLRFVPAPGADGEQDGEPGGP